VASEREGRLRYVGHVASGWTGAARAHLATLLEPRICTRPAVPSPHPGTWVKPEVYCQVRFLEWTAGGRLRGASFARLIEVVADTLQT
jgi:bifunctional non-homologous end joining protein LigD